MHATIEQRLPELREICRRHNVARLELFGSATSDAFDPTRSDLDFLIEFAPGTEKPWMGEYFAFKRDLEALLGHPVDLVTPRAVHNPYFLKSVAATRTLLYAA